MKNLPLHPLIILSAMLFTGGAFSAHAAITIGNAIHTADERNFDADASRERLDELNSEVYRAYSAILPNVSAKALVQTKKDAANARSPLFGGNNYNEYTVGLEAAQPLFVSGIFSGAPGIAKANLSIGGLDSKIIRRDLTLNVIQAFYGILLFQRNLETLKKQKEVDQELVQTVQKFYRIGRSQLLDLLQIKTQLALLAPKIASTENQIQITATQLANFLGDPNATEIQVAGSLEPPTRFALESDMKRKELHILENERIDEQRDLLDSQRSLSLSDDLPSLYAIGSVSRDSYVRSDLLNGYSTSHAIGLQLTIPIFTGLSSIYERQVFASRARQLEFNRIGTYAQTSLTQVQAKKSLDLAEANIQTSKSAFDLAESSIKEAKKNYSFGSSNLLQYLTSQQSYLDAEVAYDQAKYDYIVSFSRYAVMMGYPHLDLVQFLEKRQ